MFRNYLTIAWRLLNKNKIYSAINVAGLAVGMAACLTMLLFVQHERSFDNFHSKNLYRLNEVQNFEGMVSAQKVALSMYPMGQTLKEDFPEVRNYTRISTERNLPLNAGEKRVYFQQIFYVDTSFLDLFDFPLINGDRATALDAPNNLVLTRTSAQKLFGNDDPMGKTVAIYARDTTYMKVTGVLEDNPANSHLQFDALVSLNHQELPDFMRDWGSNWMKTYLELAPGADMAALQAKFPEYLKRHLGEENHWSQYQLFLQPLKEIHSKSADIGLDEVNYRKFDESYTNIFFLIAITILLIACVNFMNLSTARSAERAMEVGIRKSIGASRSQLSLQFVGETVLLSLVAIVLATGLVKLFLPAVNQLSDRTLSLPLFSDWRTGISLLGGSVAIGIMAGLYPAVVLAAFKPAIVMKSAMHTGRNRSLLRNTLVVGQFSCAIFLMLATGLTVRQLWYMKNRPTGFDRNQVVNLKIRRIRAPKYDVLKKDLLDNALIAGVTASQDILGSHLDQSGIEFKGDGPMRNLTATRLIVDADYLNVYRIPLVAGHNFSADNTENGREYIINETLAKELLKDMPGKGVEDLVGKHFGFDSIGQIAGVARDFNFNSLHHKIETLFLFNTPEWGFSNISVRIDGSKTREALAAVQAIWARDMPGVPFQYEFMDDHFNDVYRADTQVSTIVGVLAVLAIIISCLGLYGLASYTTSRRTKEIGIRKVLGASIAGVTGLLARDFLKLVLIAILIATPFAWYCMSLWLNDFAYRIEPEWWMFGAAGVLALLIAFLTVGFQSARAALANPVKSLRSE